MNRSELFPMGNLFSFCWPSRTHQPHEHEQPAPRDSPMFVLNPKGIGRLYILNPECNNHPMFFFPIEAGVGFGNLIGQGHCSEIVYSLPEQLDEF